MAAIQDAPVRLRTGRADRTRLLRLVRGATIPPPRRTPTSRSSTEPWRCRRPSRPRNGPPPTDERPACASLFSTAPLLETLDLSRGRDRRRCSAPSAGMTSGSADGRLLSFFTGERRHVVLKAKELQVLRPHGHILRSGSGLTPDEAGLTSTVWMAGVFHSMVTQGHVSINRFLSTTHSYLGLFRSHGQRLFVAAGRRLAAARRAVRLRDGARRLPLDLPPCRRDDRGPVAGAHRTPRAHAGDRRARRGPAALPADQSRRAERRRRLRTRAGAVRSRRHGRLRAGRSPSPMSAAVIPDGGFHLMPLPGTVVEQLGGDELLFADGSSRGQPFLCFVTAPAQSLGFSIRGGLGSECSKRNAGRLLAHHDSRVAARDRPSAAPSLATRRGSPTSCPGSSTTR